LKRRLLLGTGIVVVILSAAGAAWMGFRSGQPAATEPPPPQHETATVQRGDVTLRLAVPGVLIPLRQVSLSFDTGGVLHRMMVQPGDRVEAGQALAELALEELQRNVARTEAELKRKQDSLENTRQGADKADIAIAQVNLALAQARLAALEAGPTERERELARLSLDQARNSLWSAQASRDSIAGTPGTSGGIKGSAEASVANAEIALRMAELRYEEAMEPPSEEELVLARAEVAQAEANLNKLLATPGEDELSRAQVAVDEARARLEDARSALQQAVLRSPFAGTILSVNGQAGEYVSRDVIVLADLDFMEVLTTVGEQDILSVEIGQTAEVVLDAVPDRTYPARVSRIVPTRTPGGGVVTYQVYLTFSEPTTGMLPDMSADAEIIMAEARDVLVLPKRALKVRPGGTAQVEVLDVDGTPLQRVVEVGLIGELFAEIISGLSEGDQIIKGSR